MYMSESYVNELLNEDLRKTTITSAVVGGSMSAATAAITFKRIQNQLNGLTNRIKYAKTTSEKDRLQEEYDKLSEKKHKLFGNSRTAKSAALKYGVVGAAGSAAISAGSKYLVDKHKNYQNGKDSHWKVDGKNIPADVELVDKHETLKYTKLANDKSAKKELLDVVQSTKGSRADYDKLSRAISDYDRKVGNESGDSLDKFQRLMKSAKLKFATPLERREIISNFFDSI